MKKDSASTVDKAIRLLLTIAECHEEIGTTHLGQKLGIHKSTVSRLLLKLAEHQLVYKNKENGKFWLGPAIYQLAMIMTDLNFKDIIAIARPHIDGLRDVLQETVALEVWLGNSTVPTYSAVSSHPLKVELPSGEVLPMHAAAGAKSILSCLHSEKVELLLKGGLEQITEKTITDKAKFRENLAEYNQQGYATDNQELHKGISAIAVPIFNRIHQPIAAIVVLIPSSRYGLDPDLISKIKRKASVISTQMITSGINR